jgi:protein-S-isoprenylcysteine O-methyltransferase Ste14
MRTSSKPSWLSLELLLQLGIVVVLIPLLPLLITQRWDWWQAWVYALVFAGGFVVSRLLLARKHPDLLAERARGLDHPDAKEWDRTLAPLVALGGAAIPLVAGLDVRFGWSEGFGLLAEMLGLAVMLAGYVLATWALLENRFFSGMVRIQTERGHEVVSSGPYRWVRHPGYVGALLSYLGTSFLLDSAWALLPVLAITGVLVIRTRLEDETLQAELAGYREYAARTRFRLLPGIW